MNLRSFCHGSQFFDKGSSGYAPWTACTVSTSENQQGIVRGSTTRVRTSCATSITYAECTSSSTYMCFYVTNATTSSFTESNDTNNVYCLATSSFLSCDAGANSNVKLSHFPSKTHERVKT